MAEEPQVNVPVVHMIELSFPGLGTLSELWPIPHEATRDHLHSRVPEHGEYDFKFNGNTYSKVVRDIHGFVIKIQRIKEYSFIGWTPKARVQ